MRSRTRWRAALRWVAGLGLLGVLVLVVLRWVDHAAVVPVLQAFFPVAGVVAALLLLVLVLAREWPLAGLASVLLVPFAVLAVAPLVPRTVPAGPDDLVVMSLNLQLGRADTPTVLELVAQRHVDVLVLQEVTAAADRRLERAGIDALLPHAIGQTRESPGGTMVHSHRPLTEVEGGTEPSAFHQPVVRVQTLAGPVVLRAAHPVPPLPASWERWRHELAALERWRARQPADVPVLLVGDFNASHAHPAFRQVADTMTDAHRAAGRGWVRTWPRESTLPPFIQLDHVLVRGTGVVDAGVSVVPDTDHAAVWARLSLP